MGKTVGPGKVLISTNLTTEVREQMDATRERLREEARRRGGDQAPFVDRGAFIGWMLATLDTVLQRTAEMDATDSRLRAAEEAEERVDRKLGEMRDASVRIDVETGISSYVRKIFYDLRERGLDETQILAVARVIRDSGLEPEKVADALGQANIGGIRGLAQQLETQVADAKAAYARQLQDLQAAQNALIEDNQAWRQANSTLKADAEQLTREIQGMRTAAEEARQIVQGATLRAEELGAYIDWLRSVGVTRIDELPLETARLLAGVILLSAVGQRGDALLQVPASASRLIGMQIALSELPYLLAPREAYEKMQQAQMRRDAMAEHYAHSEAGPGGAQPPA